MIARIIATVIDEIVQEYRRLQPDPPARTPGPDRDPHSTTSAQIETSYSYTYDDNPVFGFTCKKKS